MLWAQASVAAVLLLEGVDRVIFMTAMTITATDDVAVMDMAVEVDLEDDRGQTLLATTMIDIDAAAGEGTAVEATAIATGMSVAMTIVAGDRHIMENHRTPESRHTHPNDIQNNQCYVGFFGRKSWRKIMPSIRLTLSCRILKNREEMQWLFVTLL